MADNSAIMCHMKDYLSHQIIDGGFVRYDVIIRNLFIVEYFKKNEPKHLSFKPYIKLIKMRGRVAKDWKFIKLIKSFDGKGYDLKYPMMMSRKYVHSGCTHRLACCLYFDIDEFPIIFNNHYADKHRDFSGERLVEYGFDQNLVSDLVSYTKNNILDKYGLSFS